jgi:hypothetical protein
LRTKQSEANPAVHYNLPAGRQGFLGLNHFYTQQKASVVAFFMLQKLVLTCKKLSISTCLPVGWSGLGKYNLKIKLKINLKHLRLSRAGGNPTTENGFPPARERRKAEVENHNLCSCGKKLPLKQLFSLTKVCLKSYQNFKKTFVFLLHLK